VIFNVEFNFDTVRPFGFSLDLLNQNIKRIIPKYEIFVYVNTKITKDRSVHNHK